MSEQLMHDRIQQAHTYINANKDHVFASKWRQRYHFMAECGWINDPNGLIWYKGKYHFFYQYNPYSGFWDSMHWGHAVSEDMLHWEFLPIALAPSETYDDHLKGGCFSGSAVEHEGRLWIMYTGTCNNGNGFEQSQCVAWSDDGIHFHKYAGNPVLTAPEGVAPDLFRDPKVWKHGEYFYMVCGAGRNGRAQALLYRSKDFLHWEFFSILAESRGEWGYMWECPDFFQLEDKFVLMFSPMGGGERTSVYLVGDFDYATGKFHWTHAGENDWGFDYYAPQSFLAPDGRRIMVAWANCWDWMPHWKDWGPTYRDGWNGSFNIPREVRLLPDNTLQFLPIRELQTIRSGENRVENILLMGGEKYPVTAGDGVAYELKIQIDLEKTDAEALEIHLRCDDNHDTVCRMDFARAAMTVNRDNADNWSRGTTKSVLFLRDSKTLDLHIFSDQSSVEIFAQNYRNNHSLNIFAGNEQNGIYLKACGGNALITSLESHGLKRTIR